MTAKGCNKTAYAKEWMSSCSGNKSIVKGFDWANLETGNQDREHEPDPMSSCSGN